MNPNITKQKIKQEDTMIVNCRKKTDRKVPIKVNYKTKYKCRENLSEDQEFNINSAIQLLIKKNFRPTSLLSKQRKIPFTFSLFESEPKDEFGRLPIAKLELDVSVPFEVSKYEFTGKSKDGIEYTATAVIHYQIQGGVDPEVRISKLLASCALGFQHKWHCRNLGDSVDEIDKKSVGVDVLGKKDMTKFNPGNTVQDNGVVILRSDTYFNPDVTESLIQSYKDHQVKKRNWMTFCAFLFCGLFGGGIFTLIHDKVEKLDNKKLTHFQRMRELKYGSGLLGNWLATILIAGSVGFYVCLLVLNILFKSGNVMSYPLVQSLLQIIFGPIITLLVSGLTIFHYFQGFDLLECPIELCMQA